MMAAYHARWVGTAVWLQCAYYCVCAMQISGPELCWQDERNGTVRGSAFAYRWLTMSFYSMI